MSPRSSSDFRQSAVIPVRWRDGSPQVLVISSRKGKRWVVPKGIIEPELTPAASAAKEALEEAGVSGDLREPSLGTYRYAKWGGTCVVEVFLLLVTEVRAKWEESFRRRKWLSPKAAAARLKEPDLREMVRGVATSRR